MDGLIGYHFFAPRQLTLIKDEGNCFTLKCKFCGSEKLEWANFSDSKYKNHPLYIHCKSCGNYFLESEIKEGVFVGNIEFYLKEK